MFRDVADVVARRGLQIHVLGTSSGAARCVVVNGTVAIVAVQKCGLSTAQTLWSGLSVFVGFLWGVIVFEENVRDAAGRWARAP